MQKTVKKRDGSTEAYEEEKIARVVTTAGLAPDKAHDLAASVSAWVNGLPDTHISSLQIRDKVLELLTAASANAADLYRWYEFTKEPQQKS